MPQSSCHSWSAGHLSSSESIMPCKRCETHKGVQAARIARSVWPVRHDLSSQRQHLRMAELGLSHRQPFDDQTYGNSTNTCPRQSQSQASYCFASMPIFSTTMPFAWEVPAKNSVVSYPTKVRNQQLQNISAVEIAAPPKGLHLYLVPKLAFL